jgi:hypothetical protein
MDSGRTGGATRRAAAANCAGGSRGSCSRFTRPACGPRWAAYSVRGCGRITGTGEPRPANHLRPGSRGSAVARHAGSIPAWATAAILRGAHAHGKRGTLGCCAVASIGSAAGLRPEHACPHECASAPARGETGIRSGWTWADPRRARGSRLERAGVGRRRTGRGRGHRGPGGGSGLGRFASEPSLGDLE